jgi:hypothetical protein
MYHEKGNLRDISCKMRDAGFDVIFRDCPAKGGTGGHPNCSQNNQNSSIVNSFVDKNIARYIWAIKLHNNRVFITRNTEDNVFASYIASWTIIVLRMNVTCPLRHMYEN